MTLPIMKKKRKKKDDIKAGLQRLCIEDVVVVIVLTVLVHNGKTGDELLVILKNIDEGRKQAPLLPKDPYQKVRACFWAKLGDKKEDTIGFVDLALGWLDNLISILKDIAGLKIVHEERLPLLSAWIQDFADAQIIKDNWPPQAQMLANCHALLDASCTAAASK
ncbi:hypothetical protein AAG906_003183 [Vitis piasezkii]